MAKMPITLVAVAAIVFIGMDCADNNLAGNSSGVGNGMVLGKLLEPNGANPSAGAVVTVWRKNTINTLAAVDDSSSGFLKATTTDIEGNFSIDTLKPGMYIIQGEDAHGNMVLIDSIRITKNDSVVTLPADTLKAPGAIKGSIILKLGGSPLDVFVLAYGTDRFTQANEDGTFLFEKLAQAVYTLRIISISQQYGFIDMGGICVKSGDTADIGSVELPLSELPKIQLQSYYDSLLQVVTLTWSRAPAMITQGYNVYRRGAGGFFKMPLNGSTFLIDTFYIDTAVFQDSVYTYGVAMVDGSGCEGPLSTQITLKTVSGVKTVDAVSLMSDDAGSCAAMKANNKGDYVVHVNREGWNASFVETYSPDGTLLISRNMPFETYGSSFSNFDFDSLDNIYFSTGFFGRSTVYRIDRAGAVTQLLPDTDNCLNGRFVIVNNSLLFAEGFNEDSCFLKKFSLTTGSISSWSDSTYYFESPAPFFSNAQEIFTVWHSSRLGTVSQPTLRLFSKNGSTLPAPAFFPLFLFPRDYLRYSILDISDSLFLVADGYANNRNASFDDFFKDIFISDKNMLVYDKNGAIKARYSLPGMAGAFFNAEGDIVSWDAKGNVIRLRFR